MKKTLLVFAFSMFSVFAGAATIELENNFLIKRNVKDVLVGRLVSVEIDSKQNADFKEYLDYEAKLSVEIEGNVCGSDPNTIGIYRSGSEVRIVIDASSEKFCNFSSVTRLVVARVPGVIAKGKMDSLLLKSGKSFYRIEFSADDNTAIAKFSKPQ